MSELVSVITGTWGRPRTILEAAIPSVARQAYQPVEHLIVTDGRDDELNNVLLAAGYTFDGGLKRLVCLGRNWTAPFKNGSNAAIARLVGTYLAAGDIIGCLDDDDLWDPQHVAQMVTAFRETGADVVCSDFGYLDKGVRHGAAHTGSVGTSTFMYRPAAVARAGSWLPDGYCCDGKLAERWAAAGISCVRKPGATVTVPVHNLGEPDQ